ncbi:MBL fold metallo-hydrolase [Bacillus lacus]|uniref:MBL fold metallo-hydrolase n=1 Tax=Metabacillus lacus TaxID=1983721 RepID=A0A7X2LYQ9_9BACI|nr:MBL fold metallo-hydrolase [Metabacillus lacus]MRX72621.1 MBL fold metallo-hydrolase [Metabacillus lacus]
MKWKRIPLGPLGTNAYLFLQENGDCLIIDPGGEADKLGRELKKMQARPLAILLTHAHFDHIGAVEDVRKQWKIPVYIHKKERDWLTDPALNGSQLFMGGAITAGPADHLLSGEGNLEIGSFSLKVFETPGHSPGSLSYYSEGAGIVFSGDALFQGSIGRTDLPGGNHDTLISSIHKKLLTLPEDTLVLSGHGAETTIEIEMDSNPFLNGFQAY